MNQKVARFVTQAITDELRAEGYRIVPESQGGKIPGKVVNFWVKTDATSHYRDIVGAVEISLKVECPGDPVNPVENPSPAKIKSHLPVVSSGFI